jgi:hypothetical protein
LFADFKKIIDKIRKQLFYFKYIKLNERVISESNSGRLFETLTPGAGILSGINSMSLKPDFTNSKAGIRAAATLPGRLWNL